MRPRSLYVFDRCGRFASPVAGGVIDFRRNKVNQVMGNATTFGERDFGSRDFNSAVNLNRIAIDNLAVEL